jgi:hypothetical protein
MCESNIVYFELNNWIKGKHYPNDEPFISWLSNNYAITFNNEKWVKDNQLCVVKSNVDMSINFCITATKEWVQNNCPKLLTTYQNFLRYSNDDEPPIGKFGDIFLEYLPENFGITYLEK